ncbi:hypothetical protein M2103_000973 [Ereboglobus sp. PH5-5]|nr:hypothetical protein [Ereboglobus sp. PH5-10]MDF9832759.1 hypothetical protein [Ereboglobus sp. PH5-5]
MTKASGTAIEPDPPEEPTAPKEVDERNDSAEGEGGA